MTRTSGRELASALEGLRAAFPPIELQPQRAFAEWGGTYLDASTFEEGVRGRRWPDLTPTFLEQHHDALPFLGPSSIADYLPAYVAALLAGDPVLDGLPEFLLGTLDRRNDPARFDERFAQLTDAQRVAVSRALQAVHASWGESPRARRLLATLESYWKTVEGV